MNFHPLSLSDFDSFFTLMEEAFPPSERRSKEETFFLFTNNPCYHVIGKKDTQGISAFLAYWQFDECYFIDHLAVDKRLRGKGIGSELMDTFLQEISSIVVLEVEPPIDETGKKRVKFYEKLGFHLNDFPYIQPSMQKGQPEVPLFIMSYPHPLSEEQFNTLRKRIFRNCYKVSKD